MTRTTAVLVPTLAVALAASLLPAAADAQTRFGLRAGVWADDSDPMIGAELLVPMQRSWYFNPNVEIVFANNADLLELSADFHYDFERAGNVTLWMGGGPALLITDFDEGFGPEGNQTDFAVNLLFGAGFPTQRGVIPYLQAKAVISDNSQATIAVGVRF
jgi:hypothetical protein